MRFASLFRWAVVLSALGWAGYTITDAGSTYFMMDGILDKALYETSTRYRAALANGTPPEAMAKQLRTTIAAAARHEGIPVDPGNIVVLANSTGISASMQVAFPVVRYRDSELLVLPLSVRRSVIPTP